MRVCMFVCDVFPQLKIYCSLQNCPISSILPDELITLTIFQYCYAEWGVIWFWKIIPVTSLIFYVLFAIFSSFLICLENFIVDCGFIRFDSRNIPKPTQVWLMRLCIYWIFIPCIYVVLVLSNTLILILFLDYKLLIQLFVIIAFFWRGGLSRKNISRIQ